MDKVFVNLCLGLDRLGIRYDVNLSFNELQADDRIGVLGRGRRCLEGFQNRNPIVAGIGLMTHPSEWPTLCDDYSVARYLQHSEWANNLYKPYFGDRCATWPVGIDTYSWTPVSVAKDFDFLLYDKVRWDRQEYEPRLIQPIRDSLNRRKLKFAELRYGLYEETEFRQLLARSRALIFLCEHESQGLAYQECLSCDVPVLAWDQGYCLDPNRFQWGTPEIPATSVPYFDFRCGEKFRRPEDFELQLDRFVERLYQRQFRPRHYVLENLTLEKCSGQFLSSSALATGAFDEYAIARKSQDHPQPRSAPVEHPLGVVRRGPDGSSAPRRPSAVGTI